jgi:hypothetical protein
LQASRERARLIYLSAHAAVIAGVKRLEPGIVVIADRGFSLIESAAERVLFNPPSRMGWRVKENPPYAESPGYDDSGVINRSSLFGK